MTARRAVLLAIGVAVVATLAAVGLKTWCGVPGGVRDLYFGYCYSDVPPLFFAENLHEGAVPYLDHPVEYPVLIGGLMWLAATLGGGLVGFVVWTGGFAVLAAGATAGLLASELGWRRALVFAAAPTLIMSGFVNWDLPAVALATAGLVAHRRGNDGWAGAALGCGAATKLFPGLLVVPAALAAWRLRGFRAGARTVGVAAVSWLALNVPVAVVAPDGWAEFLRLSRRRPADWDALWSVATHVTGWAATVPTLNLLTGALFVAGAAAMIVHAVRRDPPERWHLVALPLVAWFLLTSKVYSPQFSLWVLPLFALAFPGWGWWAAFAVTDVAVTATRFPYLANFTGGGLDGAWDWGPFGTALVLRAAVLAAAAWIGWRRAATHGIRPAGAVDPAARPAHTTAGQPPAHPAGWRA